MTRYTSEPLLQSAYETAGLARRIAFEVQDLSTLVNLVREGLGISIVPRLAFSTVPEGVSLIPLSPAIVRQLALAVNNPEHLPLAVAAFIRKAEELAAHGG